MRATTYGILALFLVGIVAAGAYALPFGKGMWGNGEMNQALESGDYDAYLEAFEESDRPFLAQKMTEDEFMERAEHHQEMSEQRDEVQAAMESGDYGGWKEAMSARFTEEMFDRQRNRHMNMEAVESAIESGDYDAWLEAIQDCPMADRLTELVNEGNFETFVELQQAKQDRDMELIQELSAELGLEGPGFGQNMMKGHKKGGSGFHMAR